MTPGRIQDVDPPSALDIEIDVDMDLDVDTDTSATVDQPESYAIY